MLLTGPMVGGKTGNRLEHRFIADLEKDRQHAAVNQDYSGNQDYIALALTQE